MYLSTKRMIGIFVVVVVVILVLALYGYLSGSWDVEPTQSVQ